MNAKQTITPPRQPLTRERIFQVALQIADSDGLEALSMRRLGRALGVEAMSLYEHVSNKDAVLDGLAALVLADIELPEESADWKESARQLARRVRQAVLLHPNVFVIAIARWGHVDERLRLMEAGMRICQQAGFNDDEALLVYRAVIAQLAGSLVFEINRPTPEKLEQMYAEHKARAPLNLPIFGESNPQFWLEQEEQAFEFGVDLMLNSLESLLKSRTSA